MQDEDFWNPRLNVDNAQGEPKEIVSHEVEFMEPNHEAYMIEKRRIKGVFHETLELKHFPFDCQDLSITITSERPVEEIELIASPSDISHVDQRCADDSQEWNIFRHVDIEPIEIQAAYSMGPGKRRQPGLIFTSRAARRSGYFMVNTVLISCVLCLLAFTTFSVPPKESNRLQLSLLLLLTTVTFKFAASQNLPKISYLTYLDKVVLTNFFMLVAMAVWHALARYMSTPTEFQPQSQDQLQQETPTTPNPSASVEERSESLTLPRFNLKLMEAIAFGCFMSCYVLGFLAFLLMIYWDVSIIPCMI
ncbi:hypothetical protein Ciccas_004274 [Cichlidogyrus casuarinus]|uniref:Uncharacterized protein n=1 Tax=Cichlidogyrus casuarinus TaxID=1844966 RepID=A0ABD2QBY9_9PLAT